MPRVRVLPRVRPAELIAERAKESRAEAFPREAEARGEETRGEETRTVERGRTWG